MFNYKHKRLSTTSSIEEGDEWKPVCRTDADGVVRFIKSRHAIPYSTSFEKKIYVKRDGQVIEERVCYNTRINVRNRKEISKLLKLLCRNKKEYSEILKDFFYPWRANETCYDAQCSEMVRAELCNVVAVPFEDSDDTDVFLLKSFTCESYGTLPISDSNNNILQHNSIVKTIFKKDREEINIGRLNFRFQSEMNKCDFYVSVQLYCSYFGIKLNIKNRLKNCLQESTMTIRRFNLPFPLMEEDGTIRRENHLQELFELDIYNWKFLGYKFRNSNDESFYKQIRRKNRSLSQV